jgi:hypothetical protein
MLGLLGPEHLPQDYTRLQAHKDDYMHLVEAHRGEYMHLVAAHAHNPLRAHQDDCAHAHGPWGMLLFRPFCGSDAMNIVFARVQQ